MKPYIYHLIIGSNLGDRQAQLSTAKKMIRDEIGPINRESQIYETQPWGFEDQPWFLNQALEVNTTKLPDEVLKLIKQIEVKAGRTPGEKWHARHIDIDILLCGDMVLNTPELVLPHPLLHTRNFVLVPLMDIAPEALHPVLGKTIEELYLDNRDTGEVYIFNADEQGNPL
jgi:2-amino-4-hydroxy-6-hydroxymethyldihydropteridine diphosphokinase